MAGKKIGATELCPIHGPYKSLDGSCPYCAKSLDEEQLATDAGEGQVAPGSYQDPDELPTELGSGQPVETSGVDEAPTELGNSRASRRQKAATDLDEIEPTEVGTVGRRRRVGKAEDVTVLEFAQEEEELLGILWVKEGEQRGLIYKTCGDYVIGRSEGDIVLDDPKVSNPHAKITTENDQFVIWDFGSKNGTFVNGERIRAATPLKENDEIKIGDLMFVLKVLPRPTQ